MDAIKITTKEIVNVDFFDAYHRPVEDKGDPLSKGTITEMAYVPPKVQIQEMIKAGERLDAYRQERFQNGIDAEATEPEVEITRKPNVDIVDVTREAVAVSERLKKAKTEQDTVRKADDEKQAQFAFNLKVDEEIAKRKTKPEKGA